MKEKLKSRKLWVTVGSVLLSIFYPPAIPILKLLAPAYVASQGAVDALAALKGAK